MSHAVMFVLCWVNKDGKQSFPTHFGVHVGGERIGIINS